MTRRHRTILLLILALEALIRSAIIAGTGPMTDQGLYGDDSFMSHQFAATMASGGGITQAGSPTNGFQPLFVFLLVPLYWLLDHAQATVASAVMTSAFSIAGSYFLLRLLCLLFNPRIGLIGLGLWASSAHLTRVGLNGLETSLANLFMLLILCLHVTSLRNPDRRAVSKSIVFGVVMGLAVLARMDLGLLVAIVGLDQVRVRLARRHHRQLALLLLSGAAVIAPWFIWSRAMCGSFIPVSGAATRTIAQLYGSPTGPSPSPEYFPLGDIPVEYYRSHLAEAGRRLVLDAPLSGPVVVSAGARADVAVAWLVVILVAALACRPAGHAVDALGRSMMRLLRELWFAWAFALLLLGAYCFYYFAQWHFWRYLTPCTILMILPSALLVEHIWRRIAQASGNMRWVNAVLAGAAAALTVIGHFAVFRSPDPTGIARRLYQDALHLREHLHPDARIGSFESGTLDYFLERNVYNLDGKTNARALRALREARMDRLVDELDLDYVVSSPFLIRDLLDRRGQWDAGRLTFVGRLSHVDIIAVARAQSPPSRRP